MFQLLKHVTIASGGVIPRIHPELLVRKKGGKVIPLIKPPVTAASSPAHKARAASAAKKATTKTGGRKGPQAKAVSVL